MTVLEACQKAAVKLISQRPQAIYSSTEPFALEMQDLANEVARDIMRSHDWQALTKLAVMVGDGVNTEFPFPADFNRMLLYPDRLFDSANFAFGYERITNVSEFLERQLASTGMSAPGIWTILGNRFQFAPAPPAGSQTSYPYIDGYFAQDASFAYKDQFTLDTDYFRLPQRLLVLGLVWKWRENKGMSFGADEANFTKAFAEHAGRDKGARILYTGPERMPYNAGPSYPWVLGA